MTEERSLGETEPTQADLPDEVVATVLSFDELMNSARLVERVATICYRGDLEAELDNTLNELASMVDARGHVLGDDQPLYDEKVARAQALDARATEIRGEMAKHQMFVRFRALPDDEYRAFIKRTCYDNGTPKDVVKHQNELIAACAIEPTLTAEQVNQLRSKLGVQQIVRLFASASEACTTGGLDVPKSPSFLAGPKQ